MSELLDTLFQSLTPLGDFVLGLLATYWPILAAIAVAIVAACWGLSQLSKLYARWRNADGLWTLQPRYLFNALAALLANKVIREMYEPSEQHIVDLEEGQRPGPKLAWLHPYPQAIKSTIKFNRSKTRGGKKKLEASRQIRELTEWIEVADVPDFVFFAGDKEDHFAVSLKFNGEKTQAEMEKLSEIIEKTLSAHSVELLHTKNTSTITFVVHRTEPENPLTEHPKTAEWIDENPAKSPKKLPVAVTGDGTQMWNFPTHHTVCLGETGAGKASVLHSIIRQYSNFVVDGSVVLHGIDGKAWEFRPYKQIPGLFKEVAFEVEEMSEMIFDLKEKMEKRAREMGVDLDNLTVSMSVDATPETPWHVLVIDELWDVLDELTLKHPAYQALNSIGRKGRALGFFIVSATQSVELSEIGNLRKHFVNKIALKQDSEGFNKYMLGDGAAERGFDSTAIPASTPANGYKYAGIGFVKGESGDPQLVRFAYSDGNTVMRLCADVKKKIEAKGGGQVEEEELDDFSDDGGFAISDENEQSSELDTFELDDFDDFEVAPRN